MSGRKRVRVVSMGCFGWWRCLRDEHEHEHEHAGLVGLVALAGKNVKIILWVE